MKNLLDQFDSLKQEKDTSIFIMKEALRRDFEVFQCEMSDLTLKQRLSSQCTQIINNNDTLETAKKRENFSMLQLVTIFLLVKIF